MYVIASKKYTYYIYTCYIAFFSNKKCKYLEKVSCFILNVNKENKNIFKK
jgi:hypothetical protein